jgi:hypothetical protein
MQWQIRVILECHCIFKFGVKWTPNEGLHIYAFPWYHIQCSFMSIGWTQHKTVHCWQHKPKTITTPSIACSWSPYEYHITLFGQVLWLTSMLYAYWGDIARIQKIMCANTIALFSTTINHQRFNNPPTSMHLYIHWRKHDNVSVAKNMVTSVKMCLFSYFLLGLLLIHSLAHPWIVLEIYASTLPSLFAMPAKYHSTILQRKRWEEMFSCVFILKFTSKNMSGSGHCHLAYSN